MRTTMTLGLLALTGCVIVRGSGTLATETRTVPVFQAVEARNGVEVDLVVDTALVVNEVELTVATDTNLIDKLITEVQGDTLVVDVRDNVSTRLGLAVTGEVPSLGAVMGSDGAVLNVEGLGGASIDVSAFDGAVVNVSGQGDSGVVTAADGAVLDASGLTFGDVDVDIRDGAVADICATGRVTGRVRDGAVLDVSCGGNTGAVRVSDGGVLSR